MFLYVIHWNRRRLLNLNIMEDILKTIAYYYPEGIDGRTLEWDNSEEYSRQKQLLEKLYTERTNWRNFKGRLSLQYDVADYSPIPAKNSCYYIKIFFDPSLIFSLYISPFYPGYSFCTQPHYTHNEVVWHNLTPEQEKALSFFFDAMNEYFAGYKLIPLDVLKQKIPDYSVDPFPIGEAKVFNYLFTYDPIKDETLE